MATLLQWNNSYSVKVKEIDKQHRKIFSIINELYALMQKGESSKEIDGILNKLLDYPKYHFVTEEKYFDKFGYPQTEGHTVVHNDYVGKINDFYKRRKEDKEFISFELFDFLEDWWINHITGADQAYSKFFNDNGLF